MSISRARLLLLFVILFASAADKASADDRPKGVALELRSVTVEKGGVVSKDSWSEIPDRCCETSWTAPWGVTSYRWEIPESIQPTGTTLTISVHARAAKGQRVAPAIGVSGGIVADEPANRSARTPSCGDKYGHIE